MRNHASPRNRGPNQIIQLLVTPDRQLKVTRRYPLHLKVLGRVPGQLQDLRRQIFQKGRRVHGSSCSNASMARGATFQVTMDPSDWKLESCTCRSGNHFRIGSAAVLAGSVLFTHLYRFYFELVFNFHSHFDFLKAKRLPKAVLWGLYFFWVEEKLVFWLSLVTNLSVVPYLFCLLFLVEIHWRTTYLLYRVHLIEQLPSMWRNIKVH